MQTTKVTHGSSIMAFLILLFLASPGRAQQAPPRGDRFQEEHASLDRIVDTLLATVTSPPSTQPKPVPKEQPGEPMPLPVITKTRLSFERVRALRTTIDPILVAEGLPSNLSAVILVESGGNAYALSPKGARGYWQLMPETARQYGLTVSALRDDRTDLQLSTRAAAHYLKDLYRRFGDWSLALAAYNAGADTISRAQLRAGSQSFSLLSTRRLLPEETLAYVPAVLGAMSLFGNTVRQLISNSVKMQNVIYAIGLFEGARNHEESPSSLN